MNTTITQSELNGLTDQELGELHQLLTLLLTEAEPESQERRNILASLENVTRVLGCAARPVKQSVFPMRP